MYKSKRLHMAKEGHKLLEKAVKARNQHLRPQWLSKIEFAELFYVYVDFMFNRLFLFHNEHSCWVWNFLFQTFLFLFCVWDETRPKRPNSFGPTMRANQEIILFIPIFSMFLYRLEFVATENLSN